MTKGELVKAVEPFDDNTTVVFFEDGDEFVQDVSGGLSILYAIQGEDSSDKVIGLIG